MGRFDQHPDRFSALAPEPTADGAEVFTQRLVADGAIMTLPGLPVTRHLVGHLAWLEPNRIFWFTAYGDSVADGHLLEFDAVRATPSVLFFSRHGRAAGQLAAIEQADVDDPDDYRIAWQLWQEVAPLHAPIIEECCARLMGDAPRTRLRKDALLPRAFRR